MQMYVSEPNRCPTSLPSIAYSPQWQRVCLLAGLIVSLRLLSAAPVPGELISWGQIVLPHVEPDTRFSSIEAQADCNLAITTTGTVIAWGDNTQGAATPPPGLCNVVSV